MKAKSWRFFSEGREGQKTCFLRNEPKLFSLKCRRKSQRINGLSHITELLQMASFLAKTRRMNRSRALERGTYQFLDCDLGTGLIGNSEHNAAGIDR